MGIISRAAWGARTPKRRHTIPTPTPKLWLHHTAGNETSYQGMRAIQAYHMDVKGWSDIAYSFVVCPDTFQVFEGRGAGIAGGHTQGHNTTSHAICVMGNFEVESPSARLLELIADLVRHGHTQGWWPNQFTGGHQDATGASTACPGRHLQEALPAINTLALTGEETTMADPWATKITDPDYHTNLIDLQQLLTQHAGYTGALDGLPGPLTKAAWHRLKNGRTELGEMVHRLEGRIADLETSGTVNWDTVRALVDRLDEEIGRPDD